MKCDTNPLEFIVISHFNPSHYLLLSCSTLDNLDYQIQLAEYQSVQCTRDTVQPKRVPARVLEGLIAVKKVGTTNMFEWRVVCIQAVALGYPETSAWITNNVDIYTEGLFTNFAVED